MYVRADAYGGRWAVLKVQTSVLDLRALPDFPYRLKASSDAMRQLDSFWWLRSMLGRALNPCEVKLTALEPGLYLVSRLEVSNEP